MSQETYIHNTELTELDFFSPLLFINASQIFQLQNSPNLVHSFQNFFHISILYTFIHIIFQKVSMTSHCFNPKMQKSKS